MNQHEIFMKRCLELATLGQPYCYPNPMVGAVIVHDNIIIGEGYHQQYGEAHAEVNAINSVSNIDVHKLKEATIYVSLEPCAHHGKTPPCSNLIIRHKIPKVVIGCKDPFSEVAGKGIEKLEKAGIKVITNILEVECRFLNRRFFTFHEQKRPHVILKMAVSKDGFMDIDRSQDQKGVHWITSKAFQGISHQWRHEEAAILVGHNTVVNDNPSLTVRTVSGQNPTRIILSNDGSIPMNSNVLSSDSKTIIINLIKNEAQSNIQYIKTADLSITSILAALHQQNIISVIIEGGSKTLQKFIDSNNWDEARVINSNKRILNNGVKAPILTGKSIKSIELKEETISFLMNKL